MSADDYIRYARHNLPAVLDLSEQALLNARSPVWQMNGRLVQPIRINNPNSGDGGVARPTGALVLHPVNEHLMLEHFLRAAKFAIKDRKGKWKRSAPPVELARHYIARGMWGLPVLTGIVEAPTMRPDGSILSEPGYDAATGIYLDTGGIVFPAVPDRPGREDSLAALAVLKDVIKDFPFVPDEGEPAGGRSAYRSVALSGILTAVCRKGLRTAPAHGIDATDRGTGKTLLSNTIARVATGRASATMSHGKSEEEFDKRLFSVLLKGDSVITVDNIERPIQSEEFCTVLTSEEWQCRVLGASVNRTVGTNVLFLLNGNGLTFKGDMSTRVVMCRMDAGVENPGGRRFDRDLSVWVPDHRAELVVAALTVLRAFVVAGRPGLDVLEPFGRFEDWSNLVRGALVWLGEPDPCVTRRVINAHDPDREALTMLLHAWREAIGTEEWVTAKQLAEKADPRGSAEIGHVDAEDSPADRLREALINITPRYDNPISLGQSLSKYIGRIMDGLCIREHVVLGEPKTYRIEAVSTSSTKTGATESTGSDLALS